MISVTVLIEFTHHPIAPPLSCVITDLHPEASGANLLCGMIDPLWIRIVLTACEKEATVTRTSCEAKGNNRLPSIQSRGSGLG